MLEMSKKVVAVQLLEKSNLNSSEEWAMLGIKHTQHSTHKMIKTQKQFFLRYHYQPCVMQTKKVKSRYPPFVIMLEK